MVRAPETAERSLQVRPIGFVRSPFAEKADAPRQATAEGGRGAQGRVELLGGFEDAVLDLDGFDRIWLLFWFDRAFEHGETWKPKVLPPRSETKRGLFATRSPHRPNPIGISAVRLERVEGLTLHVRDLDLIDGTPVLDVKPYIRYADAFADASAGWLDGPDPQSAWKVTIEPAAEEALAWIRSETALDVRTKIQTALALGPKPHAYRRIKPTGDPTRRVLAVKEWRARFRIEEPSHTLVVERVGSGYRAKDLAEGREPVHDLHRAFVARFGSGDASGRAGSAGELC